MSNQLSPAKDIGSRILNKYVFVLGTIFLMVGVSGIATAAGNWGTWVQAGTDASMAMEMDYDSTAQSSKQSAANQEIALSACIDSIRPPSTSAPYYNVRIATAAVADILPGTGYVIDKQEVDAMPSFVLEYDNIVLGDDQGTVLKLPDDANGYQWYFNYYGKYYDRFFVSSNGFIAFGFPNMGIGEYTTTETAGLSGKNFQFFPDPAVPNGVIAPYWHDFAPDSDSRIRWGTVNLRGVEDGIMVIWENYNSLKGINDVFSVAIRCFTSDALEPYDHDENAQNQYIYFYYKTINLDFQVKAGRYKQLFGIGIENQFGTKGLLADYGDPTSPRIYNGIKIRFAPLTGNQYKIKELNLVAYTTYGIDSSQSFLDPWAWVHISGQHTYTVNNQVYEYYGGSNVDLQTNQPDNSYDFFTDPATQLAVGTALTVIGFIPIAGQAAVIVAVGLGCMGFLLDWAGICHGMKDSDPVMMSDLPPQGRPDSYYGNYAVARNYANDATVGHLTTSGCTADALITPLIDWRIYVDSPVFPGQNFLRYDHHLGLRAFAHVHDQNGNDVGQINTELNLRIGPDMLVNYSGNSGQFPNSYDTFNDGRLSDPNNPWDPSAKTGSGVIGLASKPGVMPSVLYEDFGDYQVSDWVFPDSYYKGGYCGLDTTQGYLTTKSGLKSSLKVDKVTASKQSWGARYFKQTAWDHFTAEAKVMCDDTCPDYWNYMQLRQGDTPRVNLVFRNGNLYAYKDSTNTWYSLTSFRAATWYKIFVDVNVTGKKYDVYVDGVLKTTQAATGGPVPFSGSLSGSAYVSNIYFRAAEIGSGTGRTIWADDISIARDMALHVWYSGSSNMARVKSPQYYLDVNTPYSIAFDFYIPSATKPNLVVLFDDLRVELVWKSSKQVYVVGPNNAETAIGSAVMDTWHRICIDVWPGTGYYVSLNDAGSGTHEVKGPYALKSGYSGTSYFMYFGSKTSPGSRDVGDAYWDNVLLAVYGEG